MGSSEINENYVFLTKNHDHATTDAVWLVKRYEPASYLVQYYKVEPEDKVGIITVQSTKVAESLTQVEVSYEYIGLTDKGNAFIKEFTSTQYAKFIDEWEYLLVSYFEAK